VVDQDVSSDFRHRFLQLAIDTPSIGNVATTQHSSYLARIAARGEDSLSIAESTTAILARNDQWTAEQAVSEPYEAGWAREVIVFVRALGDPSGTSGEASIEISPDGIHWIAEGTRFPLPQERDAITFTRVGNFGAWVRVRGHLPAGSESRVLVSLHCKA
jgi:hypothetical protein